MVPSDAGRAQRQVAVVGFIVATLLLVAGVAAAVTYDDDAGTRTSAGLTNTTSTTALASSSSTGSTSTSALPGTTIISNGSTLATLQGGGTTATTRPASTTTTTAPLTSGEAERVANGLFSAYRTHDQQTATRYATPEVVNGLLLVPFHEAGFQGCVQDGELFSCRFADTGTGATYDFTVQADPANGAPLVVVFHYQGPNDTTTSSSTLSTVSSG